MIHSSFVAPERAVSSWGADTESAPDGVEYHRIRQKLIHLVLDRVQVTVDLCAHSAMVPSCHSPATTTFALSPVEWFRRIRRDIPVSSLEVLPPGIVPMRTGKTAQGMGPVSSEGPAGVTGSIHLVPRRIQVKARDDDVWTGLVLVDCPSVA